MKSLLIIISISCFSLVANSQSKFLKTGTIGEVSKTKKENENKRLYGPVDYRDFSEMVGEDFVIMPKIKSVQHYGYQLIYKEGSSGMDNVSYKEGLGLVLKLKSFEGIQGIFQDSLGNRYTTKAYNNQFSDLAPLRDLNEAAKLYLHQYLWLKERSLSTYDEGTDEYGSIPVDKLTRVKVEDIVVGTEEQKPVRFILKTSTGKIGYIDVNMSGSNQSYQYRKFYSFYSSFWTFDPKLRYKYSSSIWNLIAKSDVRLGMTAQQVKMSLGEPDNVNYSTYKSGSHEQWVYGEDSSKTYYYFENGILTAQN